MCVHKTDIITAAEEMGEEIQEICQGTLKSLALGYLLSKPVSSGKEGT